jgi:penicillin-binding protein 2
MNRLLVPKIAVLLIFSILIGRLYQLQMVDAVADQFRYTTEERTTRYLPLRPMRGEMLASDGTLLAETVPIYSVSVRPADLPPRGSRERAEVFAQLSKLLDVPSTITVSPTATLAQDPALRSDLAQGLGQLVPTMAPASALGLQPAPVGLAAPAQEWSSFEVPADRALNALRLSEVYSTALLLENPLAQLVDRSDIPGYQTLRIKEDVPREVALVLRENAPSLPGVVIEEDYRRRYPLSERIPSLSYLLGYIGRVNQCELVRQNPARSWAAGMLDSLGNAVECGIVQKQISPFELGMPRYLADDRIGKDGAEGSYESELRGQLGMQQVVVDALGRPVREPQIVQPAEDGHNLVLTIDVPLQRQVELILQNWIAESDRRRLTMDGVNAYKREYDPIRSGVAIVMEVKTGRVLAMVNWPAYDNNIWDPARAEELRELFFPRDPQRQREVAKLALQTNRAIAGQYPPGSTLKQFDAIVAMQKDVIEPDTLVRDPGRLLLEDQFVAGTIYEYPNSSRRDNQQINVSDALMVSSNVFFMSVAGGNKENVINLKDEEKTIEKGLGPMALAEGLEWFGLGQPTGIPLVGEQAGRVPTPTWKQQVMREAWTTGDTYNAAIGQGNLLVTPLQLVAAGVAVANGGTVYRPQIVRAITDAEGQVVREIAPEVQRRVPADELFFSVARDGMRRSVTEGANVAARDICSGLSIAGKTGTAEFGPLITVPTTDGKGTREVRQSHAWFVGFAPYENPEIEVLVLVEGAGDMNDGSATIAVPAVTQIMQAYFGVTPPNPLPRGCQQGMPPLPQRVETSQLLAPSRPMLDPRDR